LGFFSAQLPPSSILEQTIENEEGMGNIDCTLGLREGEGKESKKKKKNFR
jgi:hypothetical protein